MKEVRAELVENLRGKLEPKTTPASRGDAGQRTELSPNLDRLTVGSGSGRPMEPLLHIRFGGRDAERRTAADDAGRWVDVAQFFQAITPARGHRSGDAFDLDAGNHRRVEPRHRMVQARTRILNQLQAVALNEGLRYKKKLWRAGVVFVSPEGRVGARRVVAIFRQPTPVSS
jgi:hypothetical protein